MTARRSRQRFCKHLSRLVPGGWSEFAERIEEMIVTALAGKLPVAHRPRIDHLTVEHRVRERSACHWLSRLRIATRLRRWQQRHRCSVDAEPIVRGPLNIRLGINRAGKVIMEIAALRHSQQKCQ